MRKKPILAIAYDFDGTLAEGNMQDRDFIPEIGMGQGDFWKDVKKLAKDNNADEILMYMKLMLEKAEAQKVNVQRRNFKNYGKDLELFNGVEDWFKRINEYGRTSGVDIKHYIISSGIKEMIEGTKIKKYFESIFASTFLYDHHGVASWPALAVNYTTKTQYLFRINKGIDNAYDNSQINKYTEKKDRPVPFENMIFIGDGETDIPCFRLVKDQNGHSIAVYQPRKRGAKNKSDGLEKEGRVNFTAPANFEDGMRIDRIVKGIIDKISVDQELYKLGKVD